MPDATRPADFACADLTTFCRLDELGLEVTGQRLEPDRAVLYGRSQSVAIEAEGHAEDRAGVASKDAGRESAFGEGAA